ncbi:MAG: restriction endonuclease subunit S [Halomonas sp.]|uniref:restriction endonuclease subunit S n=1 Tax=Halomonas sp. TaxID=1486246 RepID=UPI002ACDA669|nr:restriction endonuclease subunit S [Halomonas sp.]MDZ7853507.1 restriction endonuclease subunit S [Halomonas sp.]
MKWTQCELGDIVTFKSGGTPSKSNPELWGGDIPWVSTKELKSGRLYNTESRVTDKAIKNKKQLVEPGTVLIAVRGMVLAKAFPVSVAMRSMIFNQDIKAVIPKDGLLGSYLPYLLRGHHNELRALADEAAHGTKRIQSDRLLSFPVRLPPVSTQSCITDILSAYDDLIENNTRRIDILEEMARRLYEEWFVHFRFPGHEEVSFKESELGRIPEGWEVENLSNLASTQYGYTESATQEPVGPKFLRGMDINKKSYIDWSSVPYCPVDEKARKKFSLSPGDILIIRMADPGKVGIVEKEVDAVFASYLVRISIVDERLSPYYLFYYLTSDQYQDYITGASTGTTRKSASAKVITGVPIAIPPADLLTKLDTFVRPLRRQLSILIDKSSNLRAQRDLLLPKLVSGEIDVSDISMPDDKEVEAA